MKKILVAILILGAPISLHAQIHAVSSTLDLDVARADQVVVGRIVEVGDATPTTGPDYRQPIVLAVEQTLKGDAVQRLPLVLTTSPFWTPQSHAMLPLSSTDEHIVHSHRLLITVKKKRSDSPYELIHTIDLDAVELSVLTADLVFLTKPADVIQAAKDEVLRSPVRLSDNQYFMWPVPHDNDALKGTIGEHWDVYVPIDERIEKRAYALLREPKNTFHDGWTPHSLAISALHLFESDKNIRILKGLLSDPDERTRQAAASVLIGWGIDVPKPVLPEETSRPEPTAWTGPLHLSGARLALTGENSVWTWGIDHGQFALLKTNNQGLNWSTCYLPAALEEFVQNEHTLLNEDDRTFIHELPLSPSFPNAYDVWLTWIEHTKDEVASRIITAHSTDQCQSWNLVTASWPSSGSSYRFPDGQYLTTQFVGQNGWALVSDDPGAGTCPQSFLKTVDGGRSWRWTPIAPKMENDLSISCPLSEWHYGSAEESWLSHPNYTGEYSRIFWKTTDGGESWKNLSAQIKLPDSIQGSNSFISSMSLPAFSPTNPSRGTLGIIFNHATDEEVNRSQQHELLAIYRTTDAGKSWELSKVSENFPDLTDNLTFQDDLQGFFYVHHSADENTVDTSLNYTSDGGITWTKHKLPADLDPETVVLRGNKLWAITNTKNESQQSSLVVSSDGGASWQNRPIEITRQPEIKITFLRPAAPSPPVGGGIPYEALVPPGADTKGHGAFADVIANRISALEVTWSDAKPFNFDAHTEEFLRFLLSSSKTEMMAYHAWSSLDALPSIMATVEHKTGKPGRLVVWSPPPGLYWAYRDGNGKWWWGYWDVVKFGMPPGMIPLAAQAKIPRKQDFDVQMHLSKSQIILGEPVWVDVRIKNQSSETLRVDTSPYCFMFNTRPLNIQIPAAEPGNGERDRRCNEQPGGNCFSTWADLKPGETLTNRYVLSGDFRITHPGHYNVQLQKTIHYAPTPDAPAAGAAEKYTPLKQLQNAGSGVMLEVLPADPEKLLAIERTLSNRAANPVPIPSASAPKDGQPTSLDEFQRDYDSQRKNEKIDFEFRHSIAEGLAAYPAAGMESIFRTWLERGDLDSYAMLGLYHLNTKNARELLAQLAESSAKPDDSAYQNHRLGAVYNLARMDDKSYVPLLEKLARDANQGLRQQAILGLGMLGSENELPFLVTLAREGATMSDRQDAIMSMGDTASLKAIPILLDLFKLPNADQPAASIVALSRLTHHQLPNAEHRTPLEVQTAWQDWWKQNQRTAHAYAPFECAAAAVVIPK